MTKYVDSACGTGQHVLAGCQPARGPAPVKDRSAGSSVFVRIQMARGRQQPKKPWICDRITRALSMSDLSFVIVYKHWQKLQVVIESSYCVEETGNQ